MPEIVFINRINGNMADATAVALSDIGEVYGVKRNDTGAVVVADGTAMTHGGTGIYSYAFDEPAPCLTYTYAVEYILGGVTYFKIGTIGGSGVETILLPGLIAKVGVVLEDPAFAIFDGVTAVPQAIQQAVREISRFAPCQSKETVTLSAGSRKIDTSGIDGLLKVLYAEYKADQEPEQLRNVKVFGSTVSIDTSLVPVEEDTAYIYCLKRHSVDDAGSTLTPELESIVAELAAAWLAINHVGDGRAQIKEAVDDVTDAQTTISAIPDVIETAIAYINDIASAAADLDGKITEAENALSAQNGAASAMPDCIATAEGNFAAGLAIIEAKTSAAEGLFTDIDAQIEQAQTNIDDAAPFNNTITEGNDPEGHKLRAASAELNLAALGMAKVRAYLSELTAATTYIKAGAREQQNASIYQGQASQYHSEALANLQTGSLFLVKASRIGSQASHQLQAVQAHVSAANGTLNLAAARLNVATIISSYTIWGEQKLAHAMQTLRAMQKPCTFRTYPEG